MTTNEPIKMTNDNVTTTGRGGDSAAGPSREASQNDHKERVADGAGREENAELEWARRHVKDEPVPLLAVRKTELLGCGVRTKKKKAVPPTAEEILRTQIRIIMDEQERTREEIFLQRNRLQDRIEELEDEISELKTRRR